MISWVFISFLFCKTIKFDHKRNVMPFWWGFFQKFAAFLAPKHVFSSDIICLSPKAKGNFNRVNIWYRKPKKIRIKPSHVTSYLVEQHFLKMFQFRATLRPSASGISREVSPQLKRGWGGRFKAILHRYFFQVPGKLRGVACPVELLGLLDLNLIIRHIDMKLSTPHEMCHIATTTVLSHSNFALASHNFLCNTTTLMLCFLESASHESIFTWQPSLENICGYDFQPLGNY